MIDRKRDLDEGSAEYRMIIRQLTGLRYTREEAGGIIEDPDPMGWGACRTLPAAEAPGQRPAFCRW